MDGVKQGLLAQDLADKLKHLEKLSKRVREQLGRTTSSAIPCVAGPAAPSPLHNDCGEEEGNGGDSDAH